MSENVWFTSDTHFGHKKMLEFRPFETVEEMDDNLIYNWNSRVDKSDRVYHLGDFSFHTREETAKILDRLNGMIHLIKGNHDKMLDRFKDRFVSYQDYKTVRVGDQRLVLFHYALKTWDMAHHGSWALYGHSHGNLEDDPNAMSMDVGVDPNGLSPVSFWEVQEHMSKKEFRPVDHHGA